MRKYEFIKYKNIYDESVILYALKEDGVEKIVDGVRYIEVTPDFIRVHMIRADGLKPAGIHIKAF